jgi:hypothetical protein
MVVPPAERRTSLRKGIMIQTRRSFLSASGLLAVFQRSAFPAGPWSDKHPDEWTADDVDKVLNHSEWVHAVTLTYLPSAARDKPNRRGEGRDTSSDFTCQVRWESGLPIRLARRFTPGPTVTHDDSYVLTINNLPVAFLADSVGNISGRLGQNEDRVKDNITAELREYSLLQPEGKEPIHAVRADWVNGDFKSSVMVTFPASEHPIQLSDGQVIFSSQIDVFRLTAAFSLKRMTYRGKLEL